MLPIFTVVLGHVTNCANFGRHIGLFLSHLTFRLIFKFEPLFEPLFTVLDYATNLRRIFRSRDYI